MRRPVCRIRSSAHAPGSFELRRRRFNSRSASTVKGLFGTSGASQNPLLSVHLALGYLANLFLDSPTLKPGGAVIFANPLNRDFDARVHGAHQAFYEKALREEKSPDALYERVKRSHAA